jgi:aspartate aminotransferase-like enzyme
MIYKQRLYAPGPVEVPPQVLEATARPTIHHRTEAFKQLFKRTLGKLAHLACVPGEDVLILAGSGTAAFESGLLACVPKGAKVIGINAGKFGERWVKLAQHYGYEVIEMKLPWGSVADPEAVKALLEQHPDTYAVMTTHSETSTGALHDVEAISSAIHETTPNALVLVDCVTSLGAAKLCPKEWQLDGVFSGSQKAMMLPPGLAFAWLSERAWSRSKNLNPSFYLDLRKERKNQREGQTAYTPAVNLVYGLEVALDMMLAEGLENVWARREKINRAVIEGATALGCKQYAERVSPAVAALYVPEGMNAPDIVKGFSKRGARIAGGQDDAKPVMIRPSVVGYADAYDALTVVALLEDVLRDLGKTVPHGQGVAAAMKTLNS